MRRVEEETMKLRPRNKVIHYNEDSYYDSLGVFDIDCIEDKHDLIECILRMIDYIHSGCPMEQKADYFMMCADLCYKFVRRFPMYKNFKHVFLNKLMEMLVNPYMNDKQKKSIQYYIATTQNSV